MHGRELVMPIDATLGGEPNVSDGEESFELSMQRGLKRVLAEVEGQ